MTINQNDNHETKESPEIKILACWARANSDPDLLELNYDVAFPTIGMALYGCRASRFRGEWHVSPFDSDICRDAESMQLNALRGSHFMSVEGSAWAELSAEITEHMEFYARNLFRISGRATMDLFGPKEEQAIKKSGRTGARMRLRMHQREEPNR